MAGVNITPNNDSTLMSVAVVSSSATAISAPAATVGQILRIYKLFLVVGGTTNLSFLDGVGGTALSGAAPLAVNNQLNLPMDGTPWFACSRGNAFVISN